MINANSMTMTGNITAMEMRLRSKIDSQEVKLTQTNEELRSLKKRVVEGEESLDS